MNNFNPFSLVDECSHSHACIIYDDLACYRKVAFDFMLSGLNNNEKCVMAIDTYRKDMIADDFSNAGLNLNEYIENESLTIIDIQSSYSSNGGFEPEKTIEIWKNETQKAIFEGYTALRAVGEATFALGNPEMAEALINYENILNQVLFREFPFKALCVYDKTLYPPEIIKGVIKTHPIFFYNDEFFAGNIHYIPPEIYIKDNAGIDEIDVWLENVRKNNQNVKNLKESEKRYREIVEGTENLVTEVDTEGRFTFMNEASRKALGLPPKECIGRLAFDFIHPEDREKTQRHFSQWIKTGDSSTTFENRQVSQSGEIRDMLWSIKLDYDNDGKITYLKSIGRDITDRKKIEKELRRSQATIASIFKAAPFGIGMAADRVITYVNDQLAVITGYSKKEMLGKSARLLYPNKEEFDRVGEDRREQYAHYGTATNEAYWKKKNGEIINVYLYSAPLNKENPSAGITFMAIDITERKQAEIKLIKSEAFLAAIISSIQDGVSVLDRNLTVLKVNPVMERWFAETMPLVGKKCYNCYHASSIPCNPCPSIRAIKSGVTESDVVPGPKKSSIEWLELFSYPILDSESGAITGVVELVRDITSRKRSEEELSNYREHLEEFVKNRTVELRNANRALEKAKLAAEKANFSKSEFLANMSHEIRTPLNAVTGFSELLTSIVEDEKQKSYLSAIKTAGKSLLTLINDILDLSKIEAGKLEIQYTSTNLKDLLNEVKQFFALQISRKKIQLIIEIDEDLPNVLELDEIRLRQILLNIVGNSVKFTEAGYIKLIAKAIRKKNKVMDVHLSVEDTGIGISEQEISYIFDSFRQPKGQDFGRFKGTGLGLTICKRLVEMMNGRILVESTLGKGSIFRIIIRDVRVSYGDVAALEEEYSPKNIRFSGEKVLVVDDIESNRLLLRELLTKVNLRVLTAENGYEALVICPEYQPEIILMDIRMPVMDGIEAAKQLKKSSKTKDIPIIAVTAASTALDRSQILEKGFSGFLSKPVSIVKLYSEFSKYFNAIGVDQRFSTTKMSDDSENLKSLYPKDLTILNRIINILESDLMAQWERFQGKQPMKDVKLFGIELKRIGLEYKIGRISKLGENLIDYVDNFDVGNMQKAIEEFPKILSEIKRSRRRD